MLMYLADWGTMSGLSVLNHTSYCSTQYLLVVIQGMFQDEMRTLWLLTLLMNSSPV